MVTDNSDEVRASGPKAMRVVSPGERQMLDDFAVWLDRQTLLVLPDDVDREGRTPAQIVDEYVNGSVA